MRNVVRFNLPRGKKLQNSDFELGVKNQPLEGIARSTEYTGCSRKNAQSLP